MDPMKLTLLIGVLAVVGVGGLMFALFGGKFEAEARKNKRIEGVAPSSKKKKNKAGAARDRAKQMAQANMQAKIREASDKEKARKSLDMKKRLVQAGLDETPPARFLMYFYVLGAIAALGTIGAGAPPIAAVGVAGVFAFFLPKFWLGKLINRRKRKFLEQFPNAIDILVRGVRSGLPVNEGLKVIGNEIPDPIKTEFHRVIDATSVGVALEDALTKMHERVDLPEVSFFRTVLVIQKQTGGNLAEALSNLSSILRDRKKLKGKIKALSSEAKMSAMIIGSLPFIVGFLVYLVRPEYIESLFIDPTGQIMIGVGLVWMSCGILMMRSMINFDV
ncbi:MAG: type II secretion system F family protein [Neomegalonema sp.]|nr:type II secretion system F family protein [Neomegalonema sp.]